VNPIGLNMANHHIEEARDYDYKMIDGEIIPHDIEFRGYDYLLDSIYLDEDKARIQAMRARKNGKRATVKRNGDWWVLYLR
jgi:hypothetical protein